jgi:hypothetical protein
MGDVFFPQETPVARGQYWCEMCWAPIEPRTQYSLEKGVYEGSFFVRRLHKKCAAILDAFMSESWETEFDYDWIYEWLKERFCEGCACENICCDSDTAWRELAFRCPRIEAAFTERNAA